MRGVKRGDVLGLCGNSGNASEPHIHFRLMDSDRHATGKGIKVYFERVRIDGELKYDNSPVKGQRISP